MKQVTLPLSLTVKKTRKAEFLAYPCGEPHGSHAGVRV